MGKIRNNVRAVGDVDDQIFRILEWNSVDNSHEDSLRATELAGQILPSHTKVIAPYTQFWPVSGRQATLTFEERTLRNRGQNFIYEKLFLSTKTNVRKFLRYHNRKMRQFKALLTEMDVFVEVKSKTDWFQFCVKNGRKFFEQLVYAKQNFITGS